MIGSFAELVVLVSLVAGCYCLLSPLRKRIEKKLNHWLNRRPGAKREKPIIDINDYRTDKKD